MIDIGLFRLVNPPPGQEDLIRATIEAIDYPWERLADAVADDPDGVILVEWEDTGQSTSGRAYGYSLKIAMGNRVYQLDRGAGFVFAHEVGHLVDKIALRDEDRNAIIALTHLSPKTNRWPAEHSWGHEQPHDEKWVSGNDYLFRHNEAFADLFVEAFAPRVWDGSFYPDAPSKGPDWLRFVHTTDDLDKFRELVLWKTSTPVDDKPEVKENTLSRDPNIDQALKDLNQWLRHNKRRTLKRGQVLAARAILRSIPCR